MKYEIQNKPITNADGVLYEVGDVVEDPSEAIVQAFGDKMVRVDDADSGTDTEEEVIPEGGESFDAEEIEDAGYRELKRIMGLTDGVKLKNPTKDDLRAALLEYYE